jgi:RND family efflux transporter MFP subunit
VTPQIDVVGTTASEERVHLSARISAYVTEVMAAAGDSVKQGQVVLRLDDREIREQLAAAEARLQQAQREFERARRLFDTAATTEQVLHRAESDYRAAQAHLEQTRVMLSYAEIASPIDGVVTERRVEAGDLAKPGQVLLTVYNPERMRLEAHVPIRLIDKVMLGAEFPVELDRPTGVVTGRVTEIVSEVDPRSRTQKVKVRLPPMRGHVIPGTFGRLWVPGRMHPAVLVPTGAVYRVGQLQVVQLVRDERGLRRVVRTGPESEGRVEILSGLEPGDVVLERPIEEAR